VNNEQSWYPDSTDVGRIDPIGAQYMLRLPKQAIPDLTGCGFSAKNCELKCGIFSNPD